MVGGSHGMGHNTTHNTPEQNTFITLITQCRKALRGNGCSVMVKHNKPHNITPPSYRGVVMVVMNGGEEQ